MPISFEHKACDWIVRDDFGRSIVFPLSTVEILQLPDHQVKYYERRRRRYESHEPPSVAVSNNNVEKIDQSDPNNNKKVPLESSSPENPSCGRLMMKINIKKLLEDQKIRRNKKTKSPRKLKKPPSVEIDLSPVINKLIIKRPQSQPKTSFKDVKIISSPKLIRSSPEQKKISIERDRCSIIDSGSLTTGTTPLPPKFDNNYKIPRKPKQAIPEPEVVMTETVTDPGSPSEDESEDDKDFEKFDDDFSKSSSSSSPCPDNEVNNDQNFEKVNDDFKSVSPSLSGHDDDDDYVLDIMAPLVSEF